MARFWMLVSAAGLGLAGCTAEGDGNDVAANQAVQGDGAERVQANQAGERATMSDALAGSAEHRRFVEALRAAGLADALGGAAPNTVFAPTDAAFAALPAEAGGDREAMATMLRGHMVAGTVTADDLRRAVERAPGNRAQLATLGGGTLSVTRDGETLVVSDASGGSARLVGAERIQSNGVIHSVDGLLGAAADE